MGELPGEEGDQSALMTHQRLRENANLEQFHGRCNLGKYGHFSELICSPDMFEIHICILKV